MMQFMERRLTTNLSGGVGDDTHLSFQADDTVSGGKWRNDVYAPFREAESMTIIDASLSDAVWRHDVDNLHAVVTVTTARHCYDILRRPGSGIDIETIGAYGLAGDDTITVAFRQSGSLQRSISTAAATATASTHRVFCHSNS